MAPDKKRRNKRKSRTAEVSSASSSSESDSESVASSIAAPAPAEPEAKKQKQTKSKTKKNTVQVVAAEDVENETVSSSLPERKATKDSDKAFEEFYLRQAAQEFANDLDKLRSAGDFSAKSVPMLIAALKQGSACFGREEKGRVVVGVEG